MSECMTQEDAMKMSNERAIYILKDYSNFMLDRNGCPTSEMYFAVQKAIKSLEKTTQEWIPVSERLPIEFLDRRILVSTVSPTGRRSVDIGLWEGGKWTTYFPIGDDRVTAWMPLPEPYRGDADE